MTDIIERAEAAMKTVMISDNDIIGATKLIPELVAGLKAARAENERLRANCIPLTDDGDCSYCGAIL